MQPTRVKLCFDDGLVDEDYKRSWFMVPPQAQVISDISYAVVEQFDLQKKCPGGILLKLDDAVLPLRASVALIRPDETLSYVHMKPLTPRVSKQNKRKLEEKEEPPGLLSFFYFNSR